MKTMLILGLLIASSAVAQTTNTNCVDPMGFNGAAVGNRANASPWGVAAGNAAKGYSWGVGIGNGADGHGLGNIAIGGDATGTNTASVLPGLTDTAEIGRGTATNQGAFHYHGVPLFDTHGVPLFSTGAATPLQYLWIQLGGGMCPSPVGTNYTTNELWLNLGGAICPGNTTGTNNGWIQTSTKIYPQ